MSTLAGMDPFYLDRRRFLLSVGAAACGTLLPFRPLLARTQRRKIRLAGSIYVGWMPWFLADEDGTLRRVGAEFGLDLEFVRADYAETITLFAGGAVDAVVMTNIDAVPAVASAGVDADVLLVGSFSDGNDAIMLRPGVGDDLRGKTLGLVEYSVSHYLLDRHLEQARIPFDAVKWVNVADSAMAATFVSPSAGIDGVVTWNPIVDEIETRHGGRRLADSRSVRREIADMLVMNRRTLRDVPEAATALLSVWFEIAARMRARPAELHDVLGRLSGADGSSYARQLEQTIFIGAPELAASTLRDPALRATAQRIRAFVERHRLLSSTPSRALISFAGEEPALLNFNPIPLERAIATNFRPALAGAR